MMLDVVKNKGRTLRPLTLHVYSLNAQVVTQEDHKLHRLGVCVCLGGRGRDVIENCEVNDKAVNPA